MTLGPLTGQVMSFIPRMGSSMTYRRRALLARQGVALEAVEGECADERMRLIPRHGMTHGLAGDRSRFEAPGTPAGIEIEAAHRRQAHDGREVGGHVSHAGPLPVDFDIR